MSFGALVPLVDGNISRVLALAAFMAHISGRAGLALEPVWVISILTCRTKHAGVLELHPRGVGVEKANGAQRAWVGLVGHVGTERSLRTTDRSGAVLRAKVAGRARQSLRGDARTVMARGTKLGKAAVLRAELAWLASARGYRGVTTEVTSGAT
jgi:hypothetical protein